MITTNFGSLVNGLGGVLLLILAAWVLTVPAVKAASKMTRDERASLYLDAARTAWADGNLSARCSTRTATVSG